MTQLTANGNTYSDAGEAAKDMQNGGHRTHLLPMLSDVLTDVADAATAADAAIAAADAAADAAIAAAIAAAAGAAALTGTSTTSRAIATGSIGLTTQSDKQFAVGVWVLIYQTSTPANYMFGQVTAYSGTSLTVDVQATGGSGTIAAWTISVAGIRGATGATGPNYAQARSAKVANYTLVAGDQGNLIDCSGTFNLTFTAGATLGTSWWCEVKNSGTGIVTLVRSSSDTIDGLTTYTMMPGEHRRFFCRTSSTFDSVVLNPFRLFGTTSTTIPMPPGYTRLGFDLQGGGSSGQHGGRGAAASATTGGRGGTGGARHIGSLVAPSAGTTITLTKGDGGALLAGRTTDGTASAGNSGSASSITWSSIVRASAEGGTLTASLDATQGGGLYSDAGVSNGAGAGWRGSSGNSEYGGAGPGLGNYYNGSTPTGVAGHSSAMGGGGGGGGGGRQAGAIGGSAGTAGGSRGTMTAGGGGAGGSAPGAGVAGNAGSTPTDGGGGGGSSATGNNGGHGAAAAGYGHGGGGGGGCDTGFTSGSGAAGAGGYWEVWGEC